jgi:hypothetical protein
MTPKEKAKELVDSFINLYEGINLGIAKKHWAKQSALIAVDEILIIFSILQIETSFCYKEFLYWEEVKTEIEKL